MELSSFSDMKNLTFLLSFFLLASFSSPLQRGGPKGFRLVSEGIWANKYEVSVAEYLEFVTAMGDSAEVYRPDPSCWNNKKGEETPTSQHYFSHPAFQHYPVVGVSHDQARRYCQWLTERSRATAGKTSFQFRLPTEAEWVIAAKAGKENALIPWDGKKAHPFRPQELRARKHGYKFNLSYPNLVLLRPDSISHADFDRCINLVADGYMITAPVNSFPPNHWGLHHIGGNVAEMVEEPGRAKGGSWKSAPYYLRVDQHESYSGATQWVGFRVFAAVE